MTAMAAPDVAVDQSMSLRRLEASVAALQQCAEALEADLLTPEQARWVLELAGTAERAAYGVIVRVADRAVAGSPWQEQGFRSPASWFAQVTRRSVPDAVSTLRTAERIAELPATAEALAQGRLSPLEARTVTAAASADPSAEDDLLQAAASLTTQGLTRFAGLVANAARDADPEHRARVRRNRYIRFWTDGEGMFRVSGGLTPEDGVDLFSAVRSRAVHVADEAMRAGVEEDQAAYDADALVALAVGDERRATFDGPTGGRPPRQVQMFLHLPYEAFERGHLVAGESCHIPGLGDMPLDVARHVLPDTRLTLVIDKGVDVCSVTELGRAVPSVLMRALEARDPTCVVPGCPVSHGLETHHYQVPFAEGGPTEMWNLARVCRGHHRMITYGAWQLRGGPGKWEWLPPRAGPSG